MNVVPDPNSPDTVLKIDLNSYMPNATSSGFDPTASSTCQMDDPLRYLGGSAKSVGYWGNDAFCYTMTDYSYSK